VNVKRNIFIAFVLNLLFSIFEFVGGIITGSVAIASDAVHDFGDAISIGVSYFLEKLSVKKPNKKFTYGYARFSVLGGLLTNLILLVSSGLVIYNAILKIINPTTINYQGMIIFAIVGLVVNLVAAHFTHGGNSLNQKAVNLHMLEDVLGWLVVLIGAIVMLFTNFYIIDPILSILVALFISINSIKNLVDITEIFLIKTPKNIDFDEILEHLTKIDGVIEVHHVHLWTIDGETNCASLHVVVNKIDSKIKNIVKEELNEHGISHVTLELETIEETCGEKVCNIKKVTDTCCHHHHH
jgi:cobalt-zinc-cadmium efflux system protein